MRTPDAACGVLAVGDVLVDNICRVNRLPSPGNDEAITSYISVSGGSAANTCAVLARLGVSCSFCGTLGSDENGRALLSCFKRLGIGTSALRIIPGNTGFTFTMLQPGGERTMLSYRDSSSSARTVDESLADCVRNSSLVLISGYMLQLKEQADFVISLAEKARENGIPVLLDTSPVIGSIDRTVLERMLSVTDILMPNLSELMTVFPSGSIDGSLSLAVNKVPAVVLKQGENGARLFVSEDCSLPKLRGLAGADIKSPAENREVLDTTGAGDSFNAGFIASFLSSDNPSDWLRSGNHTASLVISGRLCRTLNEKDTLI